MDPTLETLAWVHPAVMMVVILGAMSVTSTGLALRQARRRGRPIAPGTRRRHTRIAKPTVVLALAGFTLGPASTVLLRGWPALATLHGACGLLAAALVASAAMLGLRLQGGRTPGAAVHGLLGILGVLTGLVAAVTGIDLLP